MTSSMDPVKLPQPMRLKRSALLRKLLIGASLGALLAGMLVPQFAYSTPSQTSQLVQTQAGALPDFATLVEQVKPAVFAVQVRIDPSLRTAEGEDERGAPSPFQANPFKGTPFEHFFDGMPNQFRGGPNGRNRDGDGPMVQALGSGFFISADGYAVTNNHVVDGAAKVEVIMDDGKTRQAKVVGTDPKTDLAVIKVEGGDNFRFVNVAQKAPRIGEWVLAVGNPFGLGGTVTAGIVSAQNRDIGSGPYDDYIQIDAPVNKGNSGGPTFNLAGEVIGVNTAIYSPSGGSVGIAFDVSSTTVNQIVPVLKKQGHVERAWLGVQVQPVTEDIAQSLGLSEANGAIITQPQSGGPAEKAGLEAGDVIAKIDGVPIKDARDLARKIGAMMPDTKIDLAVIRRGKDRDMSVTLGALQDSGSRQSLAQADQSSDSIGKMGLSVAPASTVEGAGKEGVVVTDLDPSGPAAEAGVEVGDVILKVGEREVASVKDFRQALSHISELGRKKALALVKRGDDEHYVALPAKASAS